jgi:transposase-like protein
MDTSNASASVLAARLVIDTGCSYSEAGRRYGISHGPVAKAYRRLLREKRGLAPIAPTASKQLSAEARAYLAKLRRAVAFMRNHDTTSRKAAAVFGVQVEDVLREYNAQTGSNRVLSDGGLTW